MAYARELDELRREARKEIATTFAFWPKVDGRNVAAENGASFAVYDPTGTLIQGPSSVDPTDVDGIARFDLAVSAISTLAEDYSIRLTWTADGESTERLDVVFFDVVLFPFGPPSVSLNDILEERPDAGEILGRMGLLLGFDEATAAEEMAAVFAVRARVELDALVRDAVRNDAATFGASTPSRDGTAASRFVRPRLILNRERLNRVERKLACKLIYAADSTNPEDGTDEAGALYRFYKAEAELAWRGVGPLSYDAVEDLVPDSTLTDIGRVVHCRRVQA